MLLNYTALPESSVAYHRSDSVASLNIRTGEGKKTSPFAVIMLHRIEASSNLSKNEKNSLTSLIAFADEFGGGDKPKLLMQISGLINLMEQTAKPKEKLPASMEHGALVKKYFDYRKDMAPPKELSISLTLHEAMESVVQKYRGTTLAELGVEQGGYPYSVDIRM